MKKTYAISARSDRGFSLLELLVVIVIILTISAMAVPRLMTQVYATRIKYSATNLSGLLQQARMEAVRKNTYYSVQYVAGNPGQEQVVDLNTVVVATVPPAILGNTVTVAYGPGSGAPGEAALIAALNFPLGVAAGAAGLPSFNARGLPCVAPAPGAACLVTPGQGFAFFLSGVSGSAAGQGWNAVAVSPSGRCQVWSYNGAAWVQQ